MNLEILVTNNLVWSKVFAFEMHVDRHVIFSSASTDWWDEVDGDDPALLLDEVGGILGDKNFHTCVNPSRWSNSSANCRQRLPYS